MLAWLAAVTAGVLVAAAQYGRLGFASRAAIPALLRILAVTLTVALAFSAPAGRATTPPPIVALDVSKSWLRSADSSAWREARDSAAKLSGAALTLFGDSSRAGAAPPTATDASTHLRALIDAASGSGRPVVIITDGELGDAQSSAALPRGSRMIVVAKHEKPDVAVTGLDAPRAALIGDTLSARVTVTSGAAPTGAGRLELWLDDALLDSASLPALSAFAERVVVLKGVAKGQERGAVLRAVVSARNDAEVRNDTLAVGIDVGSAPAAVFVSTAPDFDSREAVGALRGVTSLPTRVYYRIAPGMWRTDGALAKVDEAAVRTAVKDAPMVVLHGDTTVFGAPRGATRGALLLFAPPVADDGEYFAFLAPASPLAGAFGPIPYDSLSPLSVSNAMPAGEWQGLLTRRGGGPDDKRVALTGWDAPRRIAVLGASGFWRWRFRGGVKSDAYATFFGSLFDWLAAGRTDKRAAIVDAGVVREGEPIRWRRGVPGDSDVIVVVSARGQHQKADSIRLTFAGGATVESPALPPGLYDIRVSGGTGVLAVNGSGELLPRRASVRSGKVGNEPSVGDAPTVRDYAWLYALAILLLCGEWLLRRRIGLR